MNLFIMKLLAMVGLLRRRLILSLAKDHLGKDASPKDRATDEYGCAESVTEILNKAIGFPIITGTWTLDSYLSQDKRFAPTQDPHPGDILVSPTGTSKLGKKAPFVGHTAIVGENGILYSNDSYTGRWMANYTLDSWKARYVDKGKYDMRFYTLV